MDENGRSRNLMVFGFVEDEKEEFDSKMEGTFGELGEKPRAEACRIRLKTTEKARPVKMSPSNSALIQQILAKARRLRRLRQSTKCTEVYVCPDRTVDQREELKKLLLELKRLTSVNPELRHFIKMEKFAVLKFEKSRS